MKSIRSPHVELVYYCFHTPGEGHRIKVNLVWRFFIANSILVPNGSKIYGAFPSDEVIHFIFVKY